ncbi:MAG: Na(+)-translocating NADH-quinone reductase subunit A [Chlamydiia bacterium]|nr:Na(+)-translocating NADH-quinone reductase subunit A [Chlamydiia bacterium]
MADFVVKEGLDIPISGKPTGGLQTLPAPKKVSLNLFPFFGVKFKLLAKVGDRVKVGQAITDDKSNPGRFFVSPGCGVIREVKRGLKRRLLDIVIELDGKEEYEALPTLDPRSASRDDILAALMKGGMMTHIRQRPFDRLADPSRFPRSIFVKAITSAPFAPPAEMHVEGSEKAFQAGLTALSKLCDGGKLHLVYREGSTCQAFTNAQDCTKHTVAGPHPAGNASVHIHHFDPIKGADDSVWTLTAQDVVAIGHQFQTGHYYTDRVISIAGPGIQDKKRGFFKVRAGFPIETLIAGRNERGLQRMISGDPLTGLKVEANDYLGFYHNVFCVIPEQVSRELFHFFRLGTHKFTASGTYASGFMDNTAREYDFTTSNHGEERAFVDGAIYQSVMPMQVPVMHLVKALMAENFEDAEFLGGLEVSAEDFALPAFVDPCKIEMVEIVKNGLRAYEHEVFA